MDTCKHDWHFIEGTERLRCERCKQETGPWTTEHLTVPTGQLSTFNFKPNYNISFHRVVDGRNEDVIGKLDFNGPEMIFEGDAAESAQVFIDWIANAFHGRLEQERKSELDACCDLLEGMHAATDGNHNYYLHAANELRKLRNIK